MESTPRLLWTPSEKCKSESNLHHYELWLKENYDLSFKDYHHIWEWSTEQPELFWKSIWEYFDISASGSFSSVFSGSMPGTRWFEGTQLNYAEHVFKASRENSPAIIFRNEKQETIEISWSELEEKTAALATYLKEIGIRKGDRIVGFIPNIPEATIAFLAANSIGAVWSSCSPDFGSSSVLERFQQIEPRVLVTVDGYFYNGKSFDKSEVVDEIIESLPTLEKVVEIPYLEKRTEPYHSTGILFEKVLSNFMGEALKFERVNFNDPIWVLYSSGTTGQPKAITHSVGGVLLEHLKYVAFHNDVKPGENYFWFTTTGWMMWNFVQATLLVGATIVLYDGSPSYPDLNSLWKMAQDLKIHHFGTSAPFIVACLKKELTPNKEFDFSSLRSISSTGAPLPPEGFDWVYDFIKKDIWLCSMSGGTDVCSAFVGGCPYEPVYEGEIQCRALGCSMFSFDEDGNPVVEDVGEMVVTKPMPSMPIFFWNDKNNERYHESYFEDYPGVWRHGDWLKITDRNSLVILGRSDATLNRHGIRIGTAEIYRVVDQIDEIRDSLIVNIERSNGDHYMPLFIVLNDGEEFSDEIAHKISNLLKDTYTRRHVPDEYVVVRDIPYTISGKKMEAPVKKLLMGRPKEKAANMGAMRNPDSLDFFEEFAQKKC